MAMINAFRALWLVIATSVRVSPKQSLICLADSAARTLSVLQPLFLAWLVVGVVDRDPDRVALAAAAFVASIAFERALSVVGTNARLGQLERVGYAFDTRVAEVTARIPTLDHLETPHYLDQLQTLRDQEWALGVALNNLLNGIATLARVGATLGLAVSADPRLLLVVAAGTPALVATRWFIRWQADAEHAAAQPGRLTFHLLDLGLTPTAGAELRVFGLTANMRTRLREAATTWRQPFVVQARRRASVETATNLVFFGTAGAVLAWLTWDVIGGTVPLDALVLAVMLVGRLQRASTQLQQSIHILSRVIRTARRFIWLLDYEQRVRQLHPGTANPPVTLRRGIRIEDLTYTYPSSDAPALDRITLDLPAGSVVALVGDNGAGKSTLVKLLVGLYQPTAGRMLVDDTDLTDLDLTSWRTRISGAFQDYATLELTAQQTVGVGDLPHLDDPTRIRNALHAGAADQVIDSLRHGLATQLGPTWPDGVGLSGGQWQRLALARGMMRHQPLLLVLDEPTAALDATTEHALFERYAHTAHAGRTYGTVTLLVTHRFSTVTAADHIIVLDHGHITETGTHHELLAQGGHYAELYELQARGYR